MNNTATETSAKLKEMLDSDCPEPGIYPGTEREKYENWFAMNQSILKHYQRSPAHARAASLEPSRTSPAMLLGSMCHTATLEMDLFNERYVAGPEGDWRTKKARAALDQLRADHPLAEIVKPSEAAKAIHFGKAIRRHPIARKLLEGRGTNEVAVVCDLEGVRCKLLLDRLTEYESYPSLVDIKTTEDARPFKFTRQATNLDYHFQAAFYHDGINAIRPSQWRYFIVACEPQEPYATVVYEVQGDELDIGRDRYKHALRMHKRCEETGIYPAYTEDLEILRLSDWAYEVAG